MNTFLGNIVPTIVDNDPTILLASCVYKSTKEGKHQRLVLRHLPNEFAVQVETLTSYPAFADGDELVVFAHESFTEGRHFQAPPGWVNATGMGLALRRALDDFRDRSLDHLPRYP